MFGVDEKLRGEDQAIDITDDRTGETHIDAQEHIPMYVNEVGYNKKLVQNVLPREITGREVHYFLHLKKPLKEGQEGTFFFCGQPRRMQFAPRSIFMHNLTHYIIPLLFQLNCSRTI